MTTAVPARRPPAAAAQDDPLAVVLPDVQKAFWLRGELAGKLGTLLAARRARDPKTRERELLNEAVELLVARSSSK